MYHCYDKCSNVIEEHYPRPNQPVRGSKTGKPIMVIFDLLGRNWALGILWHLSQEPLKFRDLQNKCETISPTTLNKRIKELTHAGFIKRTLEGYTLTEQGTTLTDLLHPLHGWAGEWAEQFQKTEYQTT